MKGKEIAKFFAGFQPTRYSPTEPLPLQAFSSACLGSTTTRGLTRSLLRLGGSFFCCSPTMPGQEVKRAVCFEAGLRNVLAERELERGASYAE